MADYAQGLTDVGMKRTPARWNPELHMIRSPILRYGFSVASVALALALAFTLQYYQFRDVEVPVLAFSIALTTWYEEQDLPCWRSCYLRLALITFSQSRFTPYLLLAEISLTFLFSSLGG